MPAEILSLDMDWFNYLGDEDLKDGIRDFFATLKTKCVLPPSIDLVPEHQYLYPWSVKILDQLSYRKMNVVNVDEHHDFYCLGEVDFNDQDETVGCWNFFAFMAHQGLLSKYSWVTNATSKTGALRERRGLWRDLKRARSLSVKQYNKRIEVVHVDKLCKVVRNRKFDGFIIVRSPEYTLRRRSVYHAVDEALQTELPQCQVRRYKCRVNFKNSRVHHRANSLFWKI